MQVRDNTPSNLAVNMDRQIEVYSWLSGNSHRSFESSDWCSVGLYACTYSTNKYSYEFLCDTHVARFSRLLEYLSTLGREMRYGVLIDLLFTRTSTTGSTRKCFLHTGPVCWYQCTSTGECNYILRTPTSTTVTGITYMNWWYCTTYLRNITRYSYRRVLCRVTSHSSRLYCSKRRVSTCDVRVRVSSAPVPCTVPGTHSRKPYTNMSTEYPGVDGFHVA
jgi:hypothetical protein